MCAQFHPKSDFVVSASLDQTIRIWDTSGLRDKTVSIRNGSSSGTGSGGFGGGGAVQHNADMFGTSDVICKYILEGHDRGVNWASFHPTLPLVASAADDRLIKLWRYNDCKAWEVDTLRGHFNNVSCVLFHPQKDLLLSNSEDRTIRVWDVGKRVGVHTFRRENDRFWILTAHQHTNLIAVGHDSGMVVFKLDRERPPAACIGSNLFFVKDKYIQLQDVRTTTATSVSVVACRRPVNAMLTGPKHLIFNCLNTAEINLLALYDIDGGSYDLVTCNNVEPGGTVNVCSVQTKSGSGCSIAFVARNRYAVLEKPSGSLGVYNFNTELTKRIEPPAGVERLFAAGNNRLLLKVDEKILLFDLSSRRVLAELTCAGGVRYVIWSPDGQFVAFLSKHNILLANSKLEYLYSFHENIRVKGGAWDENGAFIYSTLSHVKYCLHNGDQGIIHSLLDPIYIFRVCKQQLQFLNRRNEVVTEPLNCTEYLFKFALHKRQFDQVALFIRNGRLCGNAVIGFLKKKGHPEVAMQFVEDPLTRLNLALDYGHIEEAMKAAQQLDDKSVWNRLGAEALRQGNQQIVEMVYQKVRDFDRLSFLYLITGNLTKLRKMLKIAELRKDVMARYQNALLLGDIESRVRVLNDVGQIPLATVTARLHGLDELIKTAPTENGADGGGGILSPQPPLIPPGCVHHLLLPPTPINRDSADASWPLLSSYQTIFDSAMKATEGMSPEAAYSHLHRGMATSMDALPSSSSSGEAFDELEVGLTEVGWGTIDDIGGWGDGPMDGDKGGGGGGGANGVVVGADKNGTPSGFVSRGDKFQQRLMKGHPMVTDMIAAGEFEQALSTLQKRIGLMNPMPLLRFFEQLYQATWLRQPGLPDTTSLSQPLLVPDVCTLSSGHLTPARFFSHSVALEQLKEAHKLVTAGKFREALCAFKELLQMLPLAVAAAPEEENQLTEFLELARQYVLAMRLECARLQLDESEVSRNLELMSYFTCCKMQPSHSFLVLRRAMGVAWKLENFITTASFARRLLETNVSAIRGAQEELAKAKKVLMLCEQKGTDAHPINYDPSEYDNLVICSTSFTRINMGDATVRCAFVVQLCAPNTKARCALTVNCLNLAQGYWGCSLGGSGVNIASIEAIYYFHRFSKMANESVVCVHSELYNDNTINIPSTSTLYI
eukprot:GHVS01029784.1.p1 GENE.GHVS01029784.1~~GHVS01029784.1.p1  ORF type:complete len:1266 (-),score=169.97 GHVS01029784.1:250-3756(-)